MSLIRCVAVTSLLPVDNRRPSNPYAGTVTFLALAYPLNDPLSCDFDMSPLSCDFDIKPLSCDFDMSPLSCDFDISPLSWDLDKLTGPLLRLLVRLRGPRSWLRDRDLGAR